MKKTYILLTLCLALIACKKNSVDFSYSPQQPRAGQSVTFSNLSTSGEEWEWTFGDGATSTLRSPSHTYKQPGAYTVTLKVDKKKSWMATKQVTVTDTIPTFVASDSTFVIYKDYTFTANVYNPYNYDLELVWDVTDSTARTSGMSITCYFTEPEKETEVSLAVILNGDTTEIVKSFYIQNQKTNAVLMRTADGDYRQRIFDDRAEEVKVTEDTMDARKLTNETDTVQVYNGYTFTLSELKAVFPELEGFKIANRKVYYRADGLWVSNIDGSYPVQIDPLPCAAMTLEAQYNNRIYWANENGVWYMPFVGSDNNKFVTTPVQLNGYTDVTKLAADGELK